MEIYKKNVYYVMLFMKIVGCFNLFWFSGFFFPNRKLVDSGFSFNCLEIATIMTST